jgi:hypothetical protein
MKAGTITLCGLAIWQRLNEKEKEKSLLVNMFILIL